MKISRNSWHYKFMKFMDTNPQYRSTLCEYIRGFVWASFVLLCMIAVGGLFAAVLLGIIFSMGVSVWSIFHLLDPKWNDWIIYGIASWIVAALFGTVAVGRAIKNKIRDRRYQSHLYTRPPPGPFRQWWKDRHDKVCRLIEFV